MVRIKDHSEYNIQVILAAHLFGPLAGGFEIGYKGFPKDARCPVCNMDISEALKNTSLGNQSFINLHNVFILLTISYKQHLLNQMACCN